MSKNRPADGTSGAAAGSRAGRTPSVFVTDAAAESARIADVLRVAGYAVFDVPLSMLTSRAQVQLPNVVLLDVDAPGALDEIARLRRQPEAGAIDFVYFGAGDGPIHSIEGAVRHHGRAFFVRPVDVSALVRRLEDLTGGPVTRLDTRVSTPPPSLSLPRSSGAPPERTSTPSLPAPGVRTSGSLLPMSVPALADLERPHSLATLGTVSRELRELLAEAELRAEGTSQLEAPLPSPEEEIEAVLPADVLASLDEPIDGDEDEEHELRPGSGAGIDREGTGHGKHTTSGGSKPPTTASSRSSIPLTRERRFATAPVSVVSDAPVYEEPTRDSSEAPPSRASSVAVLDAVAARRFLADAITRRLSGAARFEHEGVVRRVLVRDGDLVTAASSVDRESLVSFLGARGDLPREEATRLAGKIPPYGRHAGAALVAHGWLGQDQLWAALRAHAEWVTMLVLRLSRGVAQLEVDPPGRIRSEPSVFGAKVGAEIFVELVRRAVSPVEAVDALGGEESRIGDGPERALLAECALAPAELDLVARARGGTVGDLLVRSADAEIASVVHGLALLGVLDVMPGDDAARPPVGLGSADSSSDVDTRALDEEAVRARVRARLELVEEGDYFSILGVARDATSYEIRRAFVELRRAFEPTRLLSSRLVDLADDVRKIVVVLEEAYEILRDGARRERYRRAIDARPG